MEILLIIVGAVVLLGALYVVLFNGLVTAKQKVKEAWSGIDVQLKRRYDLIPNLINTVKGYAAHEAQTLNQVVEARAKAMAVSSSDKTAQAAAENQLSSTLKSIFALSESYPDLKANQNFLELQTELSETEDQIASARRIYNNNVTAYNVKVHTFPSNVIAKRHNFGEEQFFEVDPSEQTAIKETPKVDFGITENTVPQPEKPVLEADKNL